MKGHWTCQSIFVKTNGGDVFVFAYVLYCICICAVLYSYLWQPMMMERGLWNFVYPHLSKSGHSITMHLITKMVQHIYIHLKQNIIHYTTLSQIAKCNRTGPNMICMLKYNALKCFCSLQ